MKLYIRVDGNDTIMTGHTMRCLSIARAARAMGAAPVFIVADNTMLPLITQQGFESVCLHSAWNDLEAELDILLDVIKQRQLSTLLLDSYAVTAKYMKALREVTQLVYLDDLNAFTYPCDVLINYNHYAPLLGYETCYAGTQTRLLLDSAYAPLREEFRGLPAFTCAEKVRRVLITTGGSDPYNVAGQLVEHIKTAYATQHLALEVVCGRFNPNATVLQTLAQKYKDVTIHRDIQHMAELMQTCDVAVTAGGSTLYELCACGVPSIFFTFADNQNYAKMAFADSLMLYAGDVRKGIWECVDSIVTQLRCYAADLPLRQRVSRDMQQLVDGNGAMRLAKELL